MGTVGYFLDGGTHNDPLSNQNLPLPFPDAMQEFKVETSALPAQYGYHSAGAVNVVTKSGSNEFHGDAFEFVRNYLFNARNRFQPVRDSLKRNQFGGTVGGPILKNKLFFFVGYQDSIVKSSPTGTVAYVPTPAMLQGNFQTVASTQCRPTPLTLPASLGFVNNTISPSAFSPIALNLEKYLPTTSDPCGKITYATPASFTENQGIVRIDYQMSTKNTIFGRYYVTNYETPAGRPQRRSSGGGYRRRFRQCLQRDHRRHLRDHAQHGQQLPDCSQSEFQYYRLQFVSSVILISESPASISYPAAQFGKYIGGITTTGGFGVSTTPSFQPYLTWQASDDLSWTVGAHQIAFGFLFINLKATSINYLSSNGGFTFNGQFSGLQNADLLLGMPSSFAQAAPDYGDQHQNVFGMYVQDSWKLSRRLTVSAGVRWDPFFAHTNPYNQTLTFSPANFVNGVVSTVLPNAPAGMVFGGDPGLPKYQYSSNKLANFSIREWASFGTRKGMAK